MAVTTININSQVLTFANLAAFPITGTVKTIYIAENTNFQYYWNGVAYELLTTSQTSGGGGASINYYLNGSINQGTISGVTYYEMNRTPILGLGTNFTLTNTNDYIASFLTDAGDPNQLNIPAGNWNCELYFNVSNNTGTPSFYLELYKYDGVTFTLIASSSANPEFITNGTQIDLYTTAIPVPATTLLATDRLAVRVHVNTSGNRTVTLYTEDNNLCQVITTFSTGLTALNGLIAQVQNFATGTSGTDFNISSLTNTHTFNLPTASGTNRGALSSADWTTFNNKVSSGLITSSGLTMNTARLLGRGTAGVGAVEEIVIGSGLTLTGTTLSAAGGSGITIGTTAITSGTVGRVLFEGAGNVVQQSANFFWDNTNSRLGIRVATPTASLEVLGAAPSGTTQSFAVHNSTGTNNALVVRDDGRVGIGTNSPTQFVQISKSDAATRTQLLIDNTANTGTNNLGAGIRLVAGSGGFETTGEIYANPTNGGDANARVLNIVSNRGINYVANAAFPSVTEVRHRFVGTEMGMVLYERASGNRTEALIYNLNGSSNAQYTMWAGLSFYGWIRSSTSNFIALGHGTGTGTEIMRLVSATNNVLIGTTTDVASSILTLESTTKGFLPPRMTTAQRGLIATPATGLTIFNTDNNTINQRTSSAWVDLVSSDNYDGLNIAFGTTNGTKIGTGTSQKIGFWNATPIVQPTTAVAAATFVANTSLIANDTATFDGYTIGQIVKALRNTGILA